MPAKESTASKRSGNPAKRASSPSSAKDWKQKAGRAVDILDLPSGLSAKVVNRGMRAFVAEGIVPNSLMSIVEKSLQSGKAPEMADIMKPGEPMDPKMVDEMYRLMEAVCMKCFVEPVLHPAPETEEDRSDDLVYIDEVEDEDKMFVFQWVTGGTRDVEQFRSELSTDLAALPGGSNVGGTTKPAARSGRARR